MRVLAALLTALALCGVAMGQDETDTAGRRPMTFTDLQRIKRISDPQISPGGKWVLYSAVNVDLAANTRTSHLWLIPIEGSQADRQLTNTKTGESGGRFSPDGRHILFIGTDSKTSQSQIFLADWNENDGKLGTQRQLTHLNTEADGAIWSPDSQRILFVYRVYPDCSEEIAWADEEACNKRKDDDDAKTQVKAMVFDHLLYRHWTNYLGPKRSHILVVSATDGNAIRDLTPKRDIADAEAPVFSLGGPLGYAWSPDSKEIAYVTNLDDVPAASTNNDIYTLRLDDPDAKPVKISTSPGSDDAPAYSPDGKWIAFRSQARSGYESDQFHLMAYDRGDSGIREVLPRFDRWVDEFLWAPDAKTIYFTSGELGEVNILS